MTSKPSELIVAEAGIRWRKINREEKLPKLALSVMELLKTKLALSTAKTERLPNAIGKLCFFVCKKNVYGENRHTELSSNM